tara:strand:+ start:592 stop:798 length:207 start_codon:yes stop_codon:yes gene_type:complete
MKKLLEKILTYGIKNPLAFLGFSCWGGMIPLGLLDGILGWDLPGWFISFIIILGFVFLGLSQKYEPKA